MPADERALAGRQIPDDSLRSECRINQKGRRTSLPSLAQAPYGEAFGGGNVRVREPRPEPMRKGVAQLESDG
jgi:hypothetical protein